MILHFIINLLLIRSNRDIFYLTFIILLVLLLSYINTIVILLLSSLSASARFTKVCKNEFFSLHIARILFDNVMPKKIYRFDQYVINRFVRKLDILIS